MKLISNIIFSIYARDFKRATSRCGERLVLIQGLMAEWELLHMMHTQRRRWFSFAFIYPQINRAIYTYNIIYWTIVHTCVYIMRVNRRECVHSIKFEKKNRLHCNLFSLYVCGAAQCLDVSMLNCRCRRRRCPHWSEHFVQLMFCMRVCTLLLNI